MTNFVTRWAAVQMGGTHVFADLKPGDRFHFPGKAHVTYEKGRGGWYVRSADGYLAYPRPKFRTGSGTTVVKVEETI